MGTASFCDRFKKRQKESSKTPTFPIISILVTVQLHFMSFPVRVQRCPVCKLAVAQVATELLQVTVRDLVSLQSAVRGKLLSWNTKVNVKIKSTTTRLLRIWLLGLTLTNYFLWVYIPLYRQERYYITRELSAKFRLAAHKHPQNLRRHKHYKNIPQCSHEYGLYPVCCRSCIFMLPCDANVFPQYGHWYGFSPLCRRMCVCRLAFWANDLSHRSHLYGFSPVCVRSCTWNKKMYATSALHQFKMPNNAGWTDAKY